MNLGDRLPVAPVNASLQHAAAALLLVAALVYPGAPVLAGTTGGITGSVVDDANSTPVPGAKVTVTSPSATATATTDAAGRFAFLALAPDTYVLTVTLGGYEPLSEAGQTVVADSVESVSLHLKKELKTIGHVTTNAAGSLVRPGTTSDVYTVDTATQQAAAALGGGGNLNSAYSAIATVAGVYVIPNQNGYLENMDIRGGDFNQIGYEFDGVPVNRAFDNYPSSALSSLGASEVQVYTGANPANSEGEGLSGYINQVIKTGTYPGYGEGTIGIGTPTFYHHAAVEINGSTPDRNFSYYVGVGGYNQAFRYIDNSNGASYDWLGAPLNSTANPNYANGTQYNQGPFNYALESSISERDVVANVHIAVPHRYDAGRDDIQLLWDSSSLLNDFYSTTNDIASSSCPGATSGTACAIQIGLGQPIYLTTYGHTYPKGLTWSCPATIGQTFSAASLNALSSCATQYSFPSSGVPSGSVIPPSASDTIGNNQGIVKLQYTKNFSSNAFFRIYGYTYYSNWQFYGPQSAYAPIAACCSPDYELSSHARGVSALYENQLNAKNLVSLQASYVTSTDLQVNNEFFEAGNAAVVVNAAAPISGYCYGPTGGMSINCAKGGNILQLYQIQSGKAPALPSACPNPLTASTACTYLVAENGQFGAYDTMVPRFLSASLTDLFRPSEKFLLNLGLRMDSFSYIGADTDTGAARNFWTNAYNLDNCVDTITGLPYALTTPLTSGAKCPANPATSNPGIRANWTNTPANFTYLIWQPRASGTYTFDANDVLRFSFGRYTQAPDVGYEQTNTLQEDLADYDGSHFYGFGQTSPGYPIIPETSLNYDISFEHRFKGSEMSLKITPFLRQTQNQIQNFSLSAGPTGIESGLNVGDQRSQGVEFQFQKGNFAHNGLSALISFAYTDSYIHYGSVAAGKYGTTVITTTNQAISAYNAYTAACAPGGAFVGKIGANHVPLCGVATNSSGTPVAAAPCYTTAGTPVYTCTRADVGNPYWNNPQSFIDPSQAFPTFDFFPGAVGAAAAAYGVPYAATLVLGYKANKLSITPTLQFEGGGRYGAPQSNPGINPASCSKTLSAVPGANGGSRYNSLSCGGLSAIPDIYTGVFDTPGAFIQPNLLAMNVQVKYDVSQRVSLVGTVANLFNTCWGGSVEPWTYSSNHSVCGYNIGGFEGIVLPVGNAFNPPGYPGSTVQQFIKNPYNPMFGPFAQGNNTAAPKNPLNVYLAAQIRL